MTQTRRRRFAWGKVRILLAAFALLALVLGPAVADGTLAGWNDLKTSRASFTSGEIGAVQDLTCQDSGLLGGLLNREVQLDWNAPHGVDSSQVEYEVSWKESGLLTGEDSFTTQTPEFVYRADRLSLLQALNVEFTIQPRLKSGIWTGEVTSKKASSLGLLGISLLLSCQ
ncbi:hypothetical protein [Brevibacterium sp. CFH 10365]|uniref:hypothetical protein n=1 Tax=Brevibacterium sp. CFH 10365 TaxID=2585207 RepID=UPI0012665901|nr:hypothetical protein [Brevibacterium sp. CFH 10365]